jgi:CRP-like cAMP-binding protein
MSTRPRPPARDGRLAEGGCTIIHRRKLLQALRFFASLSAAEIEPVMELFRALAYEPQDTIYFAGEPADRLFVLAHGKVKLLHHTAGGQEVVFDLIGPGEMFGSLAALGDREYPHEARALTHCCALVITAGDFHAVLQRYPAVALAVLGIVAGRLQEARDAIARLSSLPVSARVAAALLKLAEKLGTPGAGGVLIGAPLSRQDLAAMTGATTESVSRVMSQLRRDGVIASGREWVAIRDAARLAEIASFGE